MINKVETHKRICEDLNDLYERKNADYGESFAELRKEYPESICIRLTDKLNRLKKLTAGDHDQKVSNESIEDTLKDIANYAIMELIERKYHKDYGDSIGFVKDKDPIRHYGVESQKWGKRLRKDKSSIPILSVYYYCGPFNYITKMPMYKNLQIIYNDGSAEKYCRRDYGISGISWTDQVFEMAKHIYIFLDEIYQDDLGGSIFVPDMLGRNALWIALDAVDHERQEIVYNMEDPEEFDRITEL